MIGVLYYDFHHQNTWGYQEDSMAFMITTSGLPDNNRNNREKN